MFQDFSLILNYIKDFTDNKKKDELLRYAILAEAKQNNDLANIICRSKADEIATKCPKIFSSFSTSTSELLLMTGVPAHKILGDHTQPNENIIQQMGKSGNKYKFFEQKQPSELYEFYIRKCITLKSLYLGDGLGILNISLQQRCKNISFATKALIDKYQNKGTE